MSNQRATKARKKVKPKPSASAIVENSMGMRESPLARGLGIPQMAERAQISSIETLSKSMRGYLVSNFRDHLSQAYVEIGLIQTIVDVPIDDALRGGWDIKTKQLEPDQIDELWAYMDDKDDLITLGHAGKWNRLFGGSGILIIDGSDPEKPFDYLKISQGADVELRDVDMWELFYDRLNDEEFRFNSSAPEFTHYNYYGVKVHKSRVLQMKGAKAPSFIRPRLRGWGFSVVESIIRSINQYLKSTDLAFEVLDEFKLDIYKIKGLVNTLLSPDGCGPDQILKRIQMANMQKNYQNAVALDSEDDFEHKQLSFAGLAEAQAGIRMQVASDLRMPLTKIFGISAAGFNSGEDDIEVYNGMIESQIRSHMRRPAMFITKLRAQELYGFIPDDLQIEFKPLRIMSTEQEENVKTSKFNRLLSARERGEITSEEFRDACNIDNLLPIQLSATELSAIEDEQSDDIDGDESVDIKPKPESSTVAPSIGGTDTKEAPLPNRIDPYTHIERIERIMQNSATFDRKSYEADGGDNWITEGRKHFFDREKAKDKALWQQAEDATRKSLGRDNWKFTAWWYIKRGGKFH